MNNEKIIDRGEILLIIVAALGYFVDVYDLLLFGVVKAASLTGIGITDDQLSVGISLTNYQVIGLVVGGIIWGILGDKRGRLSILFGSILLYSIANIGNAFVHDLTMYKLCRFIAGVGLAGELGAGISLVMETAKNKRKNYGPQIITGFGLLGAVMAGVLGELVDWRTTYLIGGIMGIILLIMRFGVIRDSLMFLEIKNNAYIEKGNFFMFFNNKERLRRYLTAILIGLPVYFVIALLIQSAKELGAESNLTVTSGKATIVCYTVFAISDFLFTFLSGYLKTRKKIFIGLHLASLVMLFIFLFLPASSTFVFYLKYALFGIVIGYWGLLTVNASEQFGTNIRALACTTVPNFIRGSFYFIGLAFTALKGTLGLNTTILTVGIVLITIALIFSFTMEDGFDRNLDYVEE
jgi:MFS family permease